MRLKFQLELSRITLAMLVVAFTTSIETFVFAQDKIAEPGENELASVKPIVQEAVEAVKAKHPNKSADYFNSILAVASAETDSTRKYAILQLALKESIAGLQVEFASKCIDALDAQFLIPANRMKIDSIKKFIQKAKSDDERIALLGSLISEIREATLRQDFELAEDSCLVGVRSTPAKNKKVIGGYFTELRLLAEADEALLREYTKAKEHIAANPDNSSSCSIVGMYELLFLGRVEEGIIYLERSANADLLEIARIEKTSERTIDETKALAELWWKFSQSLSDGYRKKAEVRASLWYQKCIDIFTGVDKAVVEKRISDAHEADLFPYTRHDLLRKNLYRVVHKGVVDESKGVLTLYPSDPSFCQFYQAVPNEYDLEYRITRTQGKYGVFFNFPTHDRTFTWSNGGHSSARNGFHAINESINQGNARNWTSFSIADGKPYKVLIRVRKNGFKSFIDDQLVSEVRTPFAPGVARPNDSTHHTFLQPYISLGDYWGTLVVTSATVTEMR